MMLPADVMIGFSSFSCYPFCLTLSRLICVVSLLYCCWAGYVHRSSWSWSEKGARSYDFCGIHPICVGILSTYDVSFAYSWISKYRSIWFFRHSFFFCEDSQRVFVYSMSFFMASLRKCRRIWKAKWRRKMEQFRYRFFFYTVVYHLPYGFSRIIFYKYSTACSAKLQFPHPIRNIHIMIWIIFFLIFPGNSWHLAI